MHRIDTAGNVGGLFADPNPMSGQIPVVVDSAYLNDLQENLMYLLSEAAIAPVKGDHTQVYRSILAFIGAISGGVTSFDGRSGAVTLTNADIVGALAAGAIVNSFLANMASDTVKANITGGAAAPSDVTLAAFLAALNIPNATTSIFGLVKLATSAMAQAGTDVSAAVTSAALDSLFVCSLGASGYVEIPTPAGNPNVIVQVSSVSWAMSGVAPSTTFLWPFSFPTRCMHAQANDTNSIGGGAVSSGGDIPIVRCAGTTSGGTIREDSNKSDTFSGTHTLTVFGIGY